MNHRQEVHGQLLKSRSKTSALLEPADALFHRAAPPVALPVKSLSSVSRPLIRPAWNHGSNCVASQPCPNPRIAVSLVTGYRTGSCARRPDRLPDLHPVHDVFEVLRLVRLPRRDVGREGDSTTVSNKVDFAPESAARATQCVVFGLFGVPFFPAPAAAFEARTELPSTHQRSQSMYPLSSNRIWSASRIRSMTPFRRQELKW